MKDFWEELEQVVTSEMSLNLDGDALYRALGEKDGQKLSEPDLFALISLCFVDKGKPSELAVELVLDELELSGTLIPTSLDPRAFEQSYTVNTVVSEQRDARVQSWDSPDGFRQIFGKILAESRNR